MSLSRAEIEAMDKDELAATIVELSQQVADQQARIEAYSRWKDSARDELHDLADRVEDLEAANQRLRERLADAEHVQRPPSDATEVKPQPRPDAAADRAAAQLPPCFEAFNRVLEP